VVVEAVQEAVVEAVQEAVVAVEEEVEGEGEVEEEEVMAEVIHHHCSLHYQHRVAGEVT
jgi:hypothetical protein